jgi:hypothetical protein
MLKSISYFSSMLVSAHIARFAVSRATARSAQRRNSALLRKIFSMVVSNVFQKATPSRSRCALSKPVKRYTQDESCLFVVYHSREPNMRLLLSNNKYVGTKIGWKHGTNSNHLYRPEASLTGGEASLADKASTRSIVGSRHACVSVNISSVLRCY